MKHIDIKKLLTDAESYVDTSVTVCGWVRTARNSKSVSFIELNDGTCLNNIQLVIDKNEVEVNKNAFNVGAALKAVGSFVRSERNGYEIQIQTIEVLGNCPSDFPLQKKRHTVEFLRTIPHLRVRTRYFEALFAVRDQLSYAVHDYFHKNGYKYVHTPIITGSDCEGAGEMFRVTTQPWDARAENGSAYLDEESYFKDDFFGTKAGLTVSAQLEGEMAAMGLGRIYTFGPTFRAEHSNTTRHAAEFWQVEPEVCFADIDDIIEIGEDFIKSIIRDVMEHCPDEIQFFNQWVDKGLIEKLNLVLESDFGRMTYTEAVEILQKSGKEFQYPVEWGCDLQTEHEKYLTEEYLKKPVFVVDYPADIKAFYMKQNPDGKTVAATDLLVPGIGEIIGCSEREADMGKLVAAMEKRGMPLEEYQAYLDTRKYGSVPHSGFGLGFDRMLMYVTGVSNIRDTLLFPRTVGNLF
ncbi:MULTISPECIES: asparagine--tRNA ligase [Oscillospiraceae]|uniref:asparagine--tRNA ligase n=1 Tax=Oscillospiraceae TaxID=216572 RepID=UPI000B36B370|nr:MULTISPECIES: asparagine--tRNA ligase [Oscillospiraceae]OUQ46671.1 asparagine--tRNA ligase [Drancourtella sp. An12]